MIFLAGAAITALATSCLASPGFLKLDVHRRSPFDKRLVRRQNSDGSVNAQLTQNTNKLEYLVNITVGTPSQDLAVTLDTGSSDLWIPASSSSDCRKGKCDDGSFDPSKSSTYTVIQQGGFNIVCSALSSSHAQVELVTDCG